LLLSATATFAAPVQGKRHVIRCRHGYGFLPGYRSPERIEWERAQNRGPTYWYGGPAFTAGVGPAMASADAGHRHRSAMSGIAVDRRPRPSPAAAIASRILPQSNGLNDKC
jgi:hypothetical protein